MHHAALYGPRANDGHFHHQVVKLAGFEARQHAHLRTTFDLEHTHRVGGADHVVGSFIFPGDVLHTLRATALAHQIQAAANGAEHAQGQHIDLEQAHRVQIVLVPLDD